MKKLLLVLLSVLLIACSAINVFADENVTVSEFVSDVAADENADGEVEQLDIEFNPARFVENLGRMGIGMIGIFIVMGVVILVTFGLNSVSGKKNN